jgi:hypothetical protein
METRRLRILMKKNDDHARDIANWVSSELFQKYRRGQAEHGGNVYNKPVSLHLTEELLDALVYLAVLHEQMEMILEIATHAGDAEGDVQAKALKAIINLCLYGNEYGEIEREKTLGPQVFKFSEQEGKERIKERFRRWLTK